LNAKLGTGCIIDENVLIGCATGRKIAAAETVIGGCARIRWGTVIYTNVVIGDYLETGHHAIIREENNIGNHFSIWNNSAVDYGCIIGNNVKIHNNVYIAQYTTIEDDVFIAPGVIVTNDPHPICTLCMKGPTIKTGARIGGNVTLLPGITIGEHALIGAGSVVTKDVPARGVAYGNPAKVVGNVDDLDCPAGVMERPYVNGLDFQCRKKMERNE
jgi:acetyltransferase-like isoleucine patch superfamily enzyme